MSGARLTEAEREELGQSLRWHFDAHASAPDRTYASLGVENALLIVDRIVGDRLAAVEAERDRLAAAVERVEALANECASSGCIHLNDLWGRLRAALDGAGHDETSDR